MQQPVYKDSSQPIEVRVKDLLSRMTLEEKIAQMRALWVRAESFLEKGEFSFEKFKDTIKDGIGQITRIAGSSDIEPKKTAEIANRIQKFLVENTPLGIPAMMHDECLSGFMSKGATHFPQAINYGSTWNPEIIEKVTTVIRRQMRAVGTHHGLSPVLDVTRDPRWGRVEETLGEDPYLVSRIGTAYVKGLQGDDISTGVVATPKHFAGHSFSEGGRNVAPVHLGPRELREVFLFPFEVAVKEGQAYSVMCAYHEIDGVPCTASRELLTKILREEWGFDGIVVSDYGSIEMLCRSHCVAADKKGAAVISLKAGVDLELPHGVCYAGPLLEAVKEGMISETKIDTAVARILALKFKLGLFKNPFVEPEKALKLFDTPEDRQLALQVARESIVLLKNEGNLLPLAKNIKSIALIGPSADSVRNLLGDYSYTAHLAREKEAVPMVSILEGIRNKVAPDTVMNYAKGCEILGTSKQGFAEAVEAAEKSDVAIVVVGGKSGLSDTDTCGEGRDRATLDLPGVQEELVKTIYETGKPVVVVLVNGRAFAIEWIAEKIPAIVEAWLPGEEGGNAVADVLFGDYNPAGKLPVTFPREVGHEPIYYNHKPSSIKDYVFSSPKPLFPFGHGLSYTSFEYNNLRIEPKKVGNDDKIVINFDIQNSGKVKGDEAAQLYIRDIIASITRPVKELKAFKRITLEPGEKKTIKFTLSVDQLAFYNLDMKLVVEPGVFELMIGSSSDDIRLIDRFEVLGETREVGGFRGFATEVEVI